MTSRARRIVLGVLLGTPVVAAIAIGVAIVTYPRSGCACETPEQATETDLAEIVRYGSEHCTPGKAAGTTAKRDYWETPVKIACTADGGIVAISAGADKRFDTADDIQRRKVGR